MNSSLVCHHDDIEALCMHRHYRIVPIHFLAEWHKWLLNQALVSFGSVYVCVCSFVNRCLVFCVVFSYVSFWVFRTSQVIGCEDYLRCDLDWVRWGVKLYSSPFTRNLYIDVVFNKRCS